MQTFELTKAALPAPPVHQAALCLPPGPKDQAPYKQERISQMLPKGSREARRQPVTGLQGGAFPQPARPANLDWLGRSKAVPRGPVFTFPWKVLGKGLAV